MSVYYLHLCFAGSQNSVWLLVLHKCSLSKLINGRKKKKEWPSAPTAKDSQSGQVWGSLVQQIYKASFRCNFRFSSSHALKTKMGQMKLINSIH